MQVPASLMLDLAYAVLSRRAALRLCGNVARVHAYAKPGGAAPDNSRVDRNRFPGYPLPAVTVQSASR